MGTLIGGTDPDPTGCQALPGVESESPLVGRVMSLHDCLSSPGSPLDDPMTHWWSGLNPRVSGCGMQWFLSLGLAHQCPRMIPELAGCLAWRDVPGLCLGRLRRSLSWCCPMREWGWVPTSQESPSNCANWLVGLKTTERTLKCLLPASVSYGKTNFPKWLTPATVSPMGVPVVSCFFRRFSKISRWVWSRLLSNYCLCSEIQDM